MSAAPGYTAPSVLNPIPKGDLYEIVFYNKYILKEIWVKIKEIKVEGGALILEWVNSKGQTCGKRLTTGSSAEILPHTWVALRACAPPNSLSEQPKGSFTLYFSSGETCTLCYPWDKVPTVEMLSKVPTLEIPVHAPTMEMPFKISFYKHEIMYPEVMIVGSGPVGATYARTILDKKADAKVLMVEMGAQESVIVGENKKNTVGYQRDIDSFVYVIKGALSPLSIPSKSSSLSSPWPWGDKNDKFVQLGQNPDQKPEVNLPASAATRVVGGMATHWTCCTPEQHPILERAKTFTDTEWGRLYDLGRKYLGTKSDQFDESGRHQLVLHTLKERFPVIFPKTKNGERKVGPMPLGCTRSTQDRDFVFWSAVDTVLGDTVNRLNLLPNHQCTKLLYDHDSPGGDIVLAVVKRLEERTGRVYVWAKNYVVCAGAVLTPGILYNSGFRAESGSLPAMGKYMTEQTMAFCQVMLHEHLVRPLDDTDNPPEWLSTEMRLRIKEHKKKHREDPVPFPFRDPEPQVYTPVQIDYPWHTQIHRDAFQYGDVAPDLDSRLIVDLRWFGKVEPVVENCVTFSDKFRDQFNMPQPTFNYILDGETKKYNHRMMEDMIKVSLELGRYIPGSEPQFMEPGLVLHLCGTTRVGTNVKDSVVNENSKVWNVGNLWVGGNGVIRTGTACNPTITSMCYAIRGAEKILEGF